MKIRMTRCLHLFSAGLVLTILAVSEVASRSITDITLKKYFKEQRLAKIIRSALNKPGVIRSVETKYILQKVDNFNSEDTRQYWQRYFVNTKFWNRRYGPVFVYVGGEDELSGGYLMGGKNFVAFRHLALSTHFSGRDGAEGDFSRTLLKKSQETLLLLPFALSSLSLCSRYAKNAPPPTRSLLMQLIKAHNF